MQYMFAAGVFGVLLAAIIWLASKQATKEAQLQNLLVEIKKQAEEQERAKKITDTVYSMSADDARRRLCELQSKQR